MYKVNSLATRRIVLTYRTAIISLFLISGVQSVGRTQDSNAAQKKASNGPMPIYVTPLYNSEGPQVAVGEHSKKLEAADSKSILDLAAEMKKNADKLRAEVMYVLAIRLFDLGHKDESVYWFYVAQYRGRVFASILDNDKIGSIGSPAFELRQAYAAFNQLAGAVINRYAFADLNKLEKTLNKVIEDTKMPPNYSELYAEVKFIDQKLWADEEKKVSTGLASMIDYIKKNEASIKEQRKKNGLDQ